MQYDLTILIKIVIFFALLLVVDGNVKHVHAIEKQYTMNFSKNGIQFKLNIEDQPKQLLQITRFMKLML